MRFKLFFSFFLSILIISFTAAVIQADSYWVSFGGTGGTFKYLMQVDENGNITRAPVAVLDFDFPASGEPTNPYANDGTQEDDHKGPLIGPTSTALADKGTSQIIYWILTSQGSLFKFLIDKSTMKPTSALPAEVWPHGKSGVDNSGAISRDFSSLHATQHVSNRFLVVTEGNLDVPPFCTECNEKIFNPTAFGVGYNTNGTIDLSRKKRVTPRTAHHDRRVAVSSDGRMAIVNADRTFYDDSGGFTPTFTFVGISDDDIEDRIYVQALNSSGGPTGDPHVVGISGPQVAAVDVSNTLAGNKRFAVFNTRSTEDSADTTNGDNLVLQVIDATTGAKIGGNRILDFNQEMTVAWMQGLAVDPLGRFVLYTRRPVRSTATGDNLQVNNRDSLFYLKLDSTGNAVGTPKLLFSADDGPFDGAHDEPSGDEFAWPQIMGIDILKDTP